MSHVREAILDDIEELVELGSKSFQFGGLHEVYSYIPEVAAKEFEAMIESPERLLLVVDTVDGIKGMFGAVSFNVMCGHGTATYEQYLYIDESYRGSGCMRRLMKEYVAWGDRLNVVMQFMVSHVDHERFKKFYSLFGFEESERTYLRKV